MNDKSRTRNSIINILTGFGSQVVLTVLKFVVRTFFIYFLGQKYLGINGLFSDILSLLSLSELGLDTALNFKLYKPIKDGNMKRIQVLMKFYKQAYICVGLVIVLLGASLIPALPYIISDYETFDALNLNPILIYSLYICQSAFSYLFFAYKSAILKADQKEYITTIVNVLTTVFTSILQIVTLVLLKNFILYTVIAILGGVVSNLISSIFARIKYKEAFIKTKDSMSKAEIKDLFKDLGALFVFKADAVVIKVSDNLVLSAFIGLSIVGYYSNYLLFYTAIISILSKICNSFKASIGNLYVDATPEKKYLFFERMNFFIFIMYGTAAVGISVVINELIENWVGTEYVIQQPLSILIGLEILIMGIRLNLNQIRNVSGAFRQMWYRPIIGIVINFVVSAILVQYFGICGVVIGTICASIFANILVDPPIICKICFNNYISVSHYYIKNILYFILLLLIGSLDFWLCSFIFTNLGWGSVIIHAVICGLSVPMIFLVVFAKSHEAKYLISTLKKVLFKH